MNTRTALAVLLLAAAAALSGCAAMVVGGAAAGVAVASDRRLTDVIGTDERIEIQSGEALTKRFGETVHINVTSFNRQVLLSGEVPNAGAKAEAEAIVAKQPDVRTVFNELVVGPNSTLPNRSNDAYITSEVKARMTAAGKFNPLHVKVVTEANTVFLMGLVTRQEGQDAAEIARTGSGVRRVVRIFEYIVPPPPKPAEVEKKT
jgi:osmotically-inducible protein OsmY